MLVEPESDLPFLLFQRFLGTQQSSLINGLARFKWNRTGRMNTKPRPANLLYREIRNLSIFNARIGVGDAQDLGIFQFVNNVFNKYGLNRVAM